MSEPLHDRIKKIIPIINDVSPSFCLAKWYHTNIYLQTGETHSCYHPAPHKINIKEIEKDPSALHNTLAKKIERHEMLVGKQTKGCKYCWNVENMEGDHISDRHIRSASIFTEQRFLTASKSKWDKPVNPEYIEISFGNECNFKCGYCHPKASSRFYNEIREFGPVESVKNHRCDINWLKIYEREEENPYVDAFWKWWPDLNKDLTILRITGGEPLMHTSTWKLLKSLKETPMPQLELNINSNLGVKPAMVEKFVNEVKYLIENNCIKQFKLFTSIDTWNKRAEYIRTGLDLKIWEQNLDTYLTTIGHPISFMITFNILAVTTFKDLLKQILVWRKKYSKYNVTTDQFRMIQFDTPYLKEPLQYDINILPKDEFIPYMKDSLQFIRDNVDDADPTKFSELEYEKFRRVVDYMENTHYGDDMLFDGRKDFYNWFTELDIRRDTNFNKTFPEYKKFMSMCKKLNG